MPRFSPFRLLRERSSQAAGIALVMLAVLGFGVYCKVREPGNSPSDWYVSPTAERPTYSDWWDRQLHPPPTTVPVPLSARPGDVRINAFRMDFGCSDERGYARHDADEVVFLPAASADDSPTSSPVRVLALGCAYLENLSLVESTWPTLPVIRPYRLFSPQGLALGFDDARNLSGPHVPMFARLSEWGPRYLVCIELRDGTASRVLEYRMVDPVAKYGVGGRPWGEPRPSPSETLTLVFTMSSWRSAPAWLAIDVATGPSEVCEIPVAEGSDAAFAKGVCRLLKVLPAIGEHLEGPYSGGGRPSESQFVRYTPSQQATLVLLACNRELTVYQPTLQVMDRRGVLHSPTNSETQHEALMATFDLPPSETLRLRVTIQPHIVRYILPLERLPGLPPENDSLKNLLDMRVPLIRVANESDLIEVLVHALCLGPMVPGGRPSFPAGYFPHDYANTTAGDLLKEYVRHCPAGTKVRFDAQQGRLLIGKPEPLGERVRYWVRSCLP